MSKPEEGREGDFAISHGEGRDNSQGNGCCSLSRRGRTDGSGWLVVMVGGSTTSLLEGEGEFAGKTQLRYCDTGIHSLDQAHFFTFSACIEKKEKKGGGGGDVKNGRPLFFLFYPRPSIRTTVLASAMYCSVHSSAVVVVWYIGDRPSDKKKLLSFSPPPPPCPLISLSPFASTTLGAERRRRRKTTIRTRRIKWSSSPGRRAAGVSLGVYTVDLPPLSFFFFRFWLSKGREREKRERGGGRRQGRESNEGFLTNGCKKKGKEGKEVEETFGEAGLAWSEIHQKAIEKFELL